MHIQPGCVIVKLLPTASEVIILKDKHFEKDDVYLKKYAKRGVVVTASPELKFEKGNILFIDPRGGMTFYHETEKLTLIREEDILGEEVEK